MEYTQQLEDYATQLEQLEQQAKTVGAESKRYCQAFGLAKGTVLGTARAGRSILGGQFRGAGSEFASGFSGFGSFAKNMFTPKPFRTMDGGANAFSNIGKK